MQSKNKNNWWQSNGLIVIAIIILVLIFSLPEFIDVENNTAFHYSALVCTIVLFLYFLLVDYRGKKADNDIYTEKSEKSQNRTFLTIWMVTVGLAIIVVFGVLVFHSVSTKGTDDDDASKWVFNATTPLIASWIGTVLAFYFGRENFESATDRILQLNKESLDDIPVEQMMIAKKTMLNIIHKQGKTYNLANKELAKVKDIIELYKSNGKDRIPVLDENSYPKYILHLNTLEKLDDQSISLSDFLKKDSSNGLYGHNQPKGFVTVRPNLSLEEATKIRLGLEDCRDIFVTANGNDNSETFGWITDTLASRFLNLKK